MAPKTESRTGDVASLLNAWALAVGSIAIFPVLAVANLLLNMRGPVWAAQIAFVAAPLAAAVVVVAVWRHVKSRDEVRFWAPFALALVSLTAAEAYWGVTLTLRSSGRLGQVWPFDLFSAIAFAFIVVLFARIARFERLELSGRVRFVADAVCVTTLFYAGLWAFWSAVVPDEIMRRSAGILSAYSMIGALLLFGAGLLVASRQRTMTSWDRFIVAGLIVFGLAVSASPSFDATVNVGFVAPVNLIAETMYMLSYQLMVIGGGLRLREGTRVWVPPKFSLYRVQSMWPPVAGAVIVLVAVTTLGLAALLVPRSDPMHRVFIGCAAVAAVAMVARTAASGFEVGALSGLTLADPVTGAGNYSRFQHALEDFGKADQRRPLSLAFVDIDDFSQVNARVGYRQGDSVLAKAVRSMSVAVEHEVYRLGGDLFAILMPGQSIDAALTSALKVREAVGRIGVAGEPLSASIGVATMPGDARSTYELVRNADATRKWAKAHSKGRVLRYDPLVVRYIEPEERIRLTEEQTRLEGAMSLVAATEARLPHVAAHSKGVAALAPLVAEAVGCPVDEVRRIEVAALLHEIGRVALCDDRSSGPAHAELDATQLEFGARLLDAMELHDVAEWIRCQQEQWDGSGGPRGLAGEEIPVHAQVIAVCDRFDDLMQGAGADPGSIDLAVRCLRAECSSRFDPGVVAALEAVVRTYAEQRLESEVAN